VTPADGDAPAVAIFSPAPLLSIELDAAAPRDADLHLHAGGQGFWVARMVHALRARAVLCGPFGGESGTALQALMEHEAVEVRAVEIDHGNAVTVEDRRGGEPRVIVETTPPALGRHDTDELYTITVGAAIETGCCVLAGTQQASVVEDDVYRRLVADLAANDVHVVADLCGPILRCALDGGLPVLKISHEELAADGWADGGSVDDVVRGVGALHDAGAGAVVVSRAGDPAIASFDGRVVEVHAPHFEVVEPRGAGDSMTAGLAVALCRGMSFEDALRLATAAGALNVTRHGLATGHADAIEQLATRVKISDLARR
jgi:1-phosphofructokinase